MDDKKRCAGLDDITEHGNNFRDSTRVMGENWRCQIVIDCDSALGHLLGTEGHHRHGRELQTPPLQLSRPKCSWRVRRFCGSGILRLVGERLPYQRSPTGHESGDEHESTEFRTPSAFLR